MTAILICEKCSGEMRRITIFRFSGCLVFIGFFLLIPSFLIMLSIGLAGFGTIKEARSYSPQAAASSNAIFRLSRIDGVPSDFIETFRTNEIQASDSVTNLAETVRPAVRDVFTEYNRKITFLPTETGLSILFGGVFGLLAFCILLPTFIVGLILVLRKKVWRCRSCGFVFDRA